MNKTIRPLSGRGKDMYYEYFNDRIEIKWGDTNLTLNENLISQILDNFLKNNDSWYPLGASMTNPTEGGLGKYLHMQRGLSPRYASVIGAIMYNEGFINYRLKKGIEIKKII